MSLIQELFEFPVEVAELVAKGVRFGGETAGGVAYVLGEIALSAIESARTEAQR
jgi:hypothetical protein